MQYLMKPSRIQNDETKIAVMTKITISIYMCTGHGYKIYEI